MSGLFIYLMFNLDKLEKTFKIILKIIAFFLPFKKIRNKYTAVNLQSDINLYCEEIEKKAPGVMPAALKVQFVTEKEIKSYLSHNEKTVILRINYDQDKSKMLATAAYHYIKMAFLHRSKLYLDKLLIKSVNITVTKQLLSELLQYHLF